ncbi:MAG: four helix bundle protein [Bacteroidales bacterium]|nr:four helix bundle protein [Bacteroidales bacterium]
MTSIVLEERLICFAVLIIDIANDIPNTKVGSNLASQISRSGTSCALNYGEARGGESKKDFIHKIQVVLKELRETFVCLKILHNTKLFKSEENMQKALKENDELISIFVKSVKTSQRHL